MNLINNLKNTGSNDQKIIKLLWLSPNLNHYKVRFLNYLSKEPSIDLTVLAGSGRKNMGDRLINDSPVFKLINTDVTKANFGFSKVIRNELSKIIYTFDWVMIPREKKNIILFLYVLQKRKFYIQKTANFRLFSYNHPISTSSYAKSIFIDRILTKFYYRHYDRIIFYAQKSRATAVHEGLINIDKAYWANNTVDTKEINKYYKFSFPNSDKPTILFIGRLVPSKRIDLFFKYYTELQNILERENKKIKLIIIGDGPERKLVINHLKTDTSIEWKGAIVDEAEIAPLMKRASMVFVPGHSGLSINHAFAYGKPYVTIYNKGHAPEIDYLIDGKNGIILNDSFNENITRLVKLLKNFKLLNRMCINAYKTSKELSVEKWVQQIINALQL